ncbi:MAG: PBECR4 domain-containing protein [Clostridia bacterium]|nr:PBECR4 domain-containing protein [Clostridia bacterium]
MSLDFNIVKKQALQIVTRCAEEYEKELNKIIGISCLYAWISTIKFPTMRFFFVPLFFLHLTGFKLRNWTGYIQGNNDSSSTDQQDDYAMPAYIFYNRCLQHRIGTDDFDFADENYTNQKLEVLPSVLNKNLSANMIGNYDSSHPLLYTEKLIGGVKACIGFIKRESDGMYIPNTVMKTDLRKITTSYVRIIATYRKDVTDTQYSEIVYSAKKIDWSKVQFSKEYAYLPKPTQE